jgi:plastocyanin
VYRPVEMNLIQVSQLSVLAQKSKGSDNPSSGSSVVAQQPATRTSKKPFAIWVIAAGLVFSALDLLYGISSDLTKFSPSSDPLVDIMVLFIIVCFVATIGILLQKTWGYALSLLVSLGFIVGANGLDTWIPTLSHPQNFNTFVVADSIVPAVVLVAILTILCFMNRKKSWDKKKYLSSPKSFTGVLTAVITILIIIGAVAGYSLSSSSAKVATTVVQISIVNGAYNPSSSTHFSPQSVTLVIGMNNTVTWTNNDYTIHTVTSDTGAFDSGLLNNGNSWTYTFTTPGTYTYHCAIHPFMKGTIVVRGS